MSEGFGNVGGPVKWVKRSVKLGRNKYCLKHQILRMRVGIRRPKGYFGLFCVKSHVRGPHVFKSWCCVVLSSSKLSTRSRTRTWRRTCENWSFWCRFPFGVLVTDDSTISIQRLKLVSSPDLEEMIEFFFLEVLKFEPVPLYRLRDITLFFCQSVNPT